MATITGLQNTFKAEIKRSRTSFPKAYVPNDFIPLSVKAMTKLRTQNLSNTLYLFAKALAQDGPNHLDLDSTAFKLINLILLSAVEPDTAQVRSGSSKFMNRLEIIVQDNELGLLKLNNVVFPTGRFRYEITTSKENPRQQTISLKEVKKIMKIRLPGKKAYGATTSARKPKPSNAGKVKSLFSDDNSERSATAIDLSSASMSVPGDLDQARRITGDYDYERREASDSDNAGKTMIWDLDRKENITEPASYDSNLNTPRPHDTGAEDRQDEDVEVKKEVEEGDDDDSDYGGEFPSDDEEHNYHRSSDEVGEGAPARLEQVKEVSLGKPVVKRKKIKKIMKIKAKQGIKRKRVYIGFEPAIECEKCKAVFWSEATKKAHVNQGFCYSCRECPETFDERSVYVDHLKEAHEKVLYVCLLCHRHYSNPLQHKNHEQYCRKMLKKYRCTMCRMTFPDHSTRMEHQKVCKPVTCSVCSGVFPNNTGLRMHLRRVHGKFKCKYCGDESHESANELARHLKKLHYRKPVWPTEPVVCEICGKTVKKSQLRKHMKTHADPSTWPKLPCEVCGKTFKSKQSLNMHRRLHQESSMVPCTECGKRIRKNNVMDHMAMHSKILRFPCPSCEQSFVQRVQYQRHVVKHLNLTFVCEICQHTFQTPDLLRNHIKRFHKGYKLVMENFWYPSTSKSRDKFDMEMFAQKNANFKMRCVRIGGGDAVASTSTATPAPRKPRAKKQARHEPDAFGDRAERIPERIPESSVTIVSNNPLQPLEQQSTVDWRMVQQQQQQPQPPNVHVQHNYGLQRPRFMPQHPHVTHPHPVGPHNPYQFAVAATDAHNAAHFLHHMQVGNEEPLTFPDAEVPMHIAE